MPVFRIEKTNDYTVLSNYHLKDKNLSLKAKGLLSLMLSLPENWDYSLSGISNIVKDGVDSVRTAVNELENNNYLIRRQLKDSNGKFLENEYLVYEKPSLENPITGKPVTENPTELNTKESSTKKYKENNIKENSELEILFNKFWNAYPKKKNKGDVEKWFLKHKPSEDLVNTMIEKIELLKKTDQWKKDNGQFIPYPSTWLNAKGWEDEIEISSKPKSEKRFFN